MEVSDEVVAVLLGQGHEGAAHHDELDLVHAVAELLELEKEGEYVFAVWKRRIFPREFIRLREMLIGKFLGKIPPRVKFCQSFRLKFLNQDGDNDWLCHKSPFDCDVPHQKA